MPAFSEDMFIASNLKAQNGYGQNGFMGPASDLPGQHTTSGFLPKSVVPNEAWQTRKVAPTAFPTAFGCSGAKAGPKMLGRVSRK